MRVALLNLPLDSNYGGNLQRYALIRVLSNLGHDVVHLNTHYINHSSVIGIVLWWVKQIFGKIKKGNDVTFSWRKYLEKDDQERCKIAMPFYERYIPHTPVISRKDDLINYGRGFDAFIVGSDQVWRKSMTKSYGLLTYFFDFIAVDAPAKRLAYAVSMGTDVDELDIKEKNAVRLLYQLFDGVSVREDTALQLLAGYGCRKPQPKVVLDPTLLLNREDYEKLTVNTHASDGNMFCYILDPDDEKQAIISELKLNYGLVPFNHIDSMSQKPFTVEQWLRSFMDAKMIVTDSYHGFVFSLIFQKPVKVLFNIRRGNSRFTSLSSLLYVDVNNIIYNSNSLNQRLEILRKDSMDFLREGLKSF